MNCVSYGRMLEPVTIFLRMPSVSENIQIMFLDLSKRQRRKINAKIKNMVSVNNSNKVILHNNVIELLYDIHKNFIDNFY